MDIDNACDDSTTVNSHTSIHDSEDQLKQKLKQQVAPDENIISRKVWCFASFLTLHSFLVSDGPKGPPTDIVHTPGTQVSDFVAEEHMSTPCVLQILSIRVPRYASLMYRYI